MTPKMIIETVRYFSDRTVCHEYMRKLKWSSGKITCPKCGHDSCKELASRPGVLKCNKAVCQKQFSYKVGTIFENSPLGLDKWFVAVWSVANCKNGISSHELATAIGVTQKTAWHMLHRIRKATIQDSWAFSKDAAVTREQKKKPNGFGNFDSLMKKLVKVPKEEMEQKSEDTPKRKPREK